MKGYRFYVDFGVEMHEDLNSDRIIKYNPIKRSWTSKTLEEANVQFNCLAIYTDISKESLIQTGNYEGACAVFYYKNSGVATSGISPEYLRIHCTRISEKLARKLHPALIEYLEYEPQDK